MNLNLETLNNIAAAAGSHFTINITKDPDSPGSAFELIFNGGEWVQQALITQQLPSDMDVITLVDDESGRREFSYVIYSKK